MHENARSRDDDVPKAEAYTTRDSAEPSALETEGSCDAWEPTAVPASFCLCDEQIERAVYVAIH